MASIRKKLRADGSVAWHAQIRLQGFPPLTETFDQKTAANRWVQETETEIRKGKYAFQTRPHTVAEAIERYMLEVAPADKSKLRNIAGPLNFWKAEVGRYHLSTLTPSVLASARDKLLRQTTVRGTKRAPASVLRMMAPLAAVLKVAQRDWQWIDGSPLAKIAKPVAARGRVRFLSENERQRLLDACDALGHPYLKTIVIVALSTGMRLGEILSMRWELTDIGSDRPVGHAQLLETKNGDRRGVPIAGAALAALRHLSINSPAVGFVFPSHRLDGKVAMDIRRPWNEAVAKAKLTNFRFHDLRHSAASYLAMNGATPSEIAEVLGHKTLSMVKRYAHLSPAHTASVVARMNEQVFGG